MENHNVLRESRETLGRKFVTCTMSALPILLSKSWNRPRSPGHGFPVEPKVRQKLVARVLLEDDLHELPHLALV